MIDQYIYLFNSTHVINVMLFVIWQKPAIQFLLQNYKEFLLIFRQVQSVINEKILRLVPNLDSIFLVVHNLFTCSLWAVT
jgi:hypothetical protein